jgi:hypothetical protein
MKTRKRHLTILENNDITSSDYNFLITKNQLSPEWNQQIKMTYGTVGWSDHIKNTTAMTLKDNGDNISIKIGKKKVIYEYYELNMLYGMMKYYVDHSNLDPDRLTFEFSKQTK